MGMCPETRPEHTLTHTAGRCFQVPRGCTRGARGPSRGGIFAGTCLTVLELIAGSRKEG